MRQPLVGPPSSCTRPSDAHAATGSGLYNGWWVPAVPESSIRAALNSSAGEYTRRRPPRRWRCPFGHVRSRRVLVAVPTPVKRRFRFLAPPPLAAGGPNWGVRGTAGSPPGRCKKGQSCPSGRRLLVADHNTRRGISRDKIGKLAWGRDPSLLSRLAAPLGRSRATGGASRGYRRLRRGGGGGARLPPAPVVVASMGTALPHATAGIHERARVRWRATANEISSSANAMACTAPPRLGGVWRGAPPPAFARQANPHPRAGASRGLVPTVCVGIVLGAKGRRGPPCTLPHSAGSAGRCRNRTMQGRAGSRLGRVPSGGCAWDRSRGTRGQPSAVTAGWRRTTPPAGGCGVRGVMRARGRAGGGAVATAPRRPTSPLPTTRVLGGHRRRRTVAPAPTVRSLALYGCGGRPAAHSGEDNACAGHRPCRVSGRGDGGGRVGGAVTICGGRRDRLVRILLVLLTYATVEVGVVQAILYR